MNHKLQTNLMFWLSGLTSLPFNLAKLATFRYNLGGPKNISDNKKCKAGILQMCCTLLSVKENTSKGERIIVPLDRQFVVYPGGAGVDEGAGLHKGLYAPLKVA